jgi:hypothetical protein
MSNDTTTDILTRAEHHMLRSEVEELLTKNQQLRASLEQERQQYQEMVAARHHWHALYTELKTHIQDVINDKAEVIDDFDEEKLANHGIAKPPTLYSCEYEVKYTGTVTVKADSEEAARNKADEIVSQAIYCQLSEIDDDEVTDQNHNEFELDIQGCEEQ